MEIVKVYPFDVQKHCCDVFWFWARFHVNLCFECSFQEENGQSWVPLPYEVASALVRTLMLHVNKLSSTKTSLNAMLEKDPSAKKKPTQKQKETYESLQQVERHIVVNSRTGQMATPEWLASHVQVTSEGKPEFKSKRVKGTIMTMGFRREAHDNVDLTLKLNPDKTALPVRCWEFKTGQANARLAAFIDGYSHMAIELEGNASDSSAESSDDQVYDQEGLEGEGFDFGTDLRRYSHCVKLSNCNV